MEPEEEIWFDVELRPSPQALEALVAKAKSKTNKEEVRALAEVRRSLRLFEPRWRLLNGKEVEKLHVRQADMRYLLVRVTTEFDPRRGIKAHFLDARLELYAWSNDPAHPSIYDLAPRSVDEGKPHPVKLELKPSLTLVSGAGASVGSVGMELEVGTVAPIVRGFAGIEERRPYWNLEHHREAPLYGRRDFWLLFGVPNGVTHIHLIAWVQARVQTKYGALLLLPPEVAEVRQPRFTIPL